MDTSSIITQPLTSGPTFKWVFLVELIVCVILCLFFLFYFNRLFATLVSYGIRAYTWHYYRAYVDIQALQISLLGGRIFFKGIRYHGVNETILIHGGFLTWSYWKRAVKGVDISGAKGSKCRKPDGDERVEVDHANQHSVHQGENGGVRQADHLPCRITITAYGLEWFVYNRTAAYDDIVSGFCDAANRDPLARGASGSSSAGATGCQSDRGGLVGCVTTRHSQQSADNCTSAAGSSFETGKPFGDSVRPSRSDTDVLSEEAAPFDSGTDSSVPNILRLLPVQVDCTKGAIVVGNEHTRSVLTFTFDKANGLINASDAGPLDLYRQVLTFDVYHPIIQLRPNPDFKQSQLVAASELGSLPRNENVFHSKVKPFSNRSLRKRKLWHNIRDIIPYFQKSVESFHTGRSRDRGPKSRTVLPGEVRWLGLTRYLDDNMDEHEGWDAIEYGKFSTIVDCPSLTLSYYWDVAGKVPSKQSEPYSSARDILDDINGSNPPQWGLDLKINGGTLNYGPWADRERVGLQNVFFPNPYRNARPASQLRPGDSRRSTIFEIRVEINEDTTLRIPTREESKDWQWKDRADAIRRATMLKRQNQKRESRNKEVESSKIGTEIRPFGWFSLRVARDSTINYKMDMVASKSGLRNYLTLDLRDCKLSSSVNHGLLWQCPRQVISCDLSNPLIWNCLHTWVFNIECRDLELFLLRDHIFLLTDLVGDWASGSSSNYFSFVPFVYDIKLRFTDFRLFLNVNDSNIINNPSDLDDNAFVLIKGRRLTSDIGIPLTQYRPEENRIKFNVALMDAGIDLIMPLWHTLHSFQKDKSVATLKNLTLEGSYTYNLSTSPALTDTLVLIITGGFPSLCLYGFLIRSFMKLRDNYFGEEMHFKTLEEFQGFANSPAHLKSHSAINPNRRSNDLDVMLQITANNASVLLPTNIYDHSNAVRVTAVCIEADMRFTNYYMDLQTVFSPLEVSLKSQTCHQTAVSNTQLFIDGVSIYGHRLFGLPPSEPTYVCNWDFDIGKIVGESSPEFIRSLVVAVQNIDFTLDDEENALPPLLPVALHDVTFLRATVESIHLSIVVEHMVLILSSGSVNLQFNDWAESLFSGRLNLTIPDIMFAAVDRKSASRYQGKRNSNVTTYAAFQTTVELTLLHRKWNFSEDRKLQQQHIRMHDQRTHRTPWLLPDHEQADTGKVPVKSTKVHPPAMVVPSMPDPIIDSVILTDTSSLHSANIPGNNSLSRASSSSWRRSIRKRNSANNSNLGKQASGIERNDKSIPSIETSRVKNTVSTKNPYFRFNSPTHKEASFSMTGQCSSWAIPHFLYHKLVIDISQLPSLSPPGDKGFNDELSALGTAAPVEDQDTAHINVFCQLVPGLRGYFTPEFLSSISSLILGLQPSRPTDILDLLQTDVVSGITHYEKSIKTPKKTTGMSIKIPSVRLRLTASPRLTDTDSEIQFQDEWNISFTNIRVGFRTNVERRQGDLLEGIQRSLTMHSAADIFSVSVEGIRDLQDKTELHCSLEETNFWLVMTPGVRSRLQTRSFDIATSAKSAEQLALLVQRTVAMLDSILSPFQHLSFSNQRLRFLVYSLTKSAAGIPDPLFLTRPSYVLRASQSHLRSHDSWKVLSRLRNVYENLSSTQRQALESGFMETRLSYPKDAKFEVLSSFDRWRSWDLAHAEDSYVMRKIWGSPKTSVGDSATSPLNISAAVKRFRLLIDPGPQQSDFVIQSMSMALNISPSSKSVMNGGRKSSIILQSYCSSAALRLRWEVLDLVEGVARTIPNITLKSTKKNVVSAENVGRPIELHIVLGTDAGSVTLDGINLQLDLTGRGLKSSLVFQSQISKSPEQMSLLLSGETCSANFSSSSKSLMIWRNWDPNVLCSYILTKSQSYSDYDWKAAGSCRSLRYELKDDPLSLIHTVDQVMNGEVTYVRDLIRRLEVSDLVSAPSSPNEIPGRHRFYAALFLDHYDLAFSLLPSLSYSISGEVARMSIMPRNDSRIEVDFDLKTNSHVFRAIERERQQIVSSLNMPPINGRLLGRFASHNLSIETDITVELIRLEASAVRSLLNVISRSEMSHLILDFKNNIMELSSRFKNTPLLKDPIRPPTEISSSREILYKICLTMAGMEIHARAPGLRSQEYSAHMDFSFAMVQMRLDNGFELGYSSEFPEFHVSLSQVALDLRRQEGSLSESCGGFVLDARILGKSRPNERGDIVRVYDLASKGLEVELFADSASLIVDIAAHLQERIRTLDISQDVKRFRKLRHLAQPDVQEVPDIEVTDKTTSPALFDAIYTIEFVNIQVSWNMVEPVSAQTGRESEDLVFSIKCVTLSRTRENAAKLRIEGMQLQMAPKSNDKRKRSLNSALMPELVFNVAYLSTPEDLRLAFQAAGKSLDIRATSEFILPASHLQHSIASASEKLRDANAVWETTSSLQSSDNRGLFGNKRLTSLLVDVDFAGAVVSLLGRRLDDQQTVLTSTLRGSRPSEGRYGQYVQGDLATTASLQAPGVALKVQFGDNGKENPTLNAELRVNPSTNVLYPTVVPLIKQITASVEEVVGEQDSKSTTSTNKLQAQKQTSLDATNPDTILGRCKLNIGLRICQQKFSLSCQPITRVSATAQFDDIYMAINTVQSPEQRRFFAVLVTFNSLQASVKHAYSNESTASFEVKSITVSLMNSKHVSTNSGISAILKVSPMKAVVNAKQVQDFLLFREIWLPSNDELVAAPAQAAVLEPQSYIVRRYQQVAAAGAFPWNSTIAIDELEIQLDLGQTLGKAEFKIRNLWLTSKKASDWEQNLCIGFDGITIESTGRMNGSIELRSIKVRTFIKWPDEEPSFYQTPLIQMSIAFGQLQAKISFEYQPFLIADIASFEFLMYNVRNNPELKRDRLVSILEGEKVQVFCTTLTASQSLALFQTWQRLAQDKQAAYESSLKEIEKYLRRRASVFGRTMMDQSSEESQHDDKAPISLHTDVVVTLRAINVGAFPSTFYDNQIFKVEALDVQAQFAVSLDMGKIHSALGLTLGQLSVALSGVNRPTSTALEDLSVSEVSSRATGSRGRTILKVPRVVASMETWQTPASNEIEYTFKISFEGKVDVGWNYSRISFIRGMWTNHSRALASRLGKPLPPSAVRITGGPEPEGESGEYDAQQKITAVVNVPQSKYVYRALEPPVIETPQLRDMGEATPPLEWIGLHRDKLPNIMHQIIIVALLEVAKEVEDAYSKILGS
ncbi:hypothetical protein Egran_03182 [Elaphomyces granulatus]|uniref:Elongation factor 2 n=1 Tax=Elaphomyces granulatus TaxID=519963 RepID=A0A232LY58_9EURO|nr:hypothetical protein Egran_03182 [Elaphomyces granulatus]